MNDINDPFYSFNWLVLYYLFKLNTWEVKLTSCTEKGIVKIVCSNVCLY